MTDSWVMREYVQGDVVRLPVRVRDPHGVQVVYAIANREESYPVSDTNPGTVGSDETNCVRLEGFPSRRGYDPETVELGATVTNQATGVYVCRNIRAIDMLSFETSHPLEPPKRFRIVESPEDDREGPEILDVGEFS